MNPNDPLARLLQRLPAPPLPPDAARDRALHRATLALAAASTAHHPPATSTATRLLHRWTFAGGLAALLALTLWRSAEPRQAVSADSLAEDRIVLGQMERLFGPQLDAVVERGGSAPVICLGPSSETNHPPASLAQPVWIRFTRVDGHTTSVLSYSGRTVELSLAGRTARFEPLVTGQDGVILNGDGFCWTSSHPAEAWNGYRIAAQLLPHS